MTDCDLLKKYVSAGSEEAFAQIVERHSRMVYATCFGILHHSHLAEDAAQATFILLIRHAKLLSPKASLAIWLFRTARTAALDARKLKERRVKYEMAAMQINHGRFENDLVTSWNDMLGEVNLALALLPTVQREAVILRFIEGRSQSEVARELGCPEETVHTRTNRALAKLRSVLKRKGMDISASTLTPLLTEIAQSVPSNLNASIKSICFGKTAASPIALEITKEVIRAMLFTKVRLCAAAMAAIILFGIGIFHIGQASEKNSTSAAPPLSLRSHANEVEPSADKTTSVEKKDETLEFGPESDGLMANLKYLSDHKAAPLVFEITVKNVSDHKIEPLGLNLSSNWVFRWERIGDTHTVFTGKFQGLGVDWPIAVYRSTSRRFFFRDEGGVFYRKYSYMMSKGEGAPKPWPELPPGRYRVTAEYWGAQPGYRIINKGHENSYHGKLITNCAEVEVPPGNGSTVLRKD